MEKVWVSVDMRIDVRGDDPDAVLAEARRVLLEIGDPRLSLVMAIGRGGMERLRFDWPCSVCGQPVEPGRSERGYSETLGVHFCNLNECGMEIERLEDAASGPSDVEE